MQRNVGGVIVASIIPFTNNGKINENALREHIDFLVANGINGLYMCGTYGQGPLMSIEQRNEVTRIAVEAANGRVPVVAHVGASTTRFAVELCKYATEVKADAVAAVAPWYYRHDDKAIISYYEAIASATNLPLFVYNNPARTGINIAPKLLARLAEIDNLLGIKDSSENLVQFCNNKLLVEKKGFRHIIGSDDQMLAGLLMGAHGAVVALGNVFPQFHVGIYKALKENNIEEAKKLQFKVIKIREVLRRGPYISAYHEAIKLLGREGGFTLKPLREVTSEERKTIRKGLESLNLL